jgi:hypothetical protein
VRESSFNKYKKYNSAWRKIASLTDNFSLNLLFIRGRISTTTHHFRHLINYEYVETSSRASYHRPTLPTLPTLPVEVSPPCREVELVASLFPFQRNPSSLHRYLPQLVLPSSNHATEQGKSNSKSIIEHLHI